MSSFVDHYAVLGLLPSAQDFLVRAAYKALAQRYHPDRFQGPSEEAHRRMAELNAAYAVLSDPTARAEYDRSRQETPPSDYYFGEEARTQEPPNSGPLENDWAVAARYYPDIRLLEDRLSKISWRLANTYRATLLESKAFARRSEIARAMEREFLELYFGSNDSIIKFAQQLIQDGHRSAALTLNRTINVLGASTDPARIIGDIIDRHKLSRLNTWTKICLYCRSEIPGFADYCVHCHKRLNP